MKIKMVIQPNLNERMRDYLRLKTKLHCLKADIYFLKQCKINKIIPSFIKVKCAVKNNRTQQVLKFSKQKWLILEIRYLYSKLSNIEMETYETHCFLMKNLHYIYYVDFMDICSERIKKYAKERN